MRVFTEAKVMQKWAATRKRDGSKIGLVPTMGYLHAGHLSLIKRAKTKRPDELVVSIFVNPVQFCPGEDYASYPRDIEADIEKCRAAGATAVFIPKPEAMYAKDHSVYVNEEELSKGLCGARRPGHFRGVCTVLTKLFNIVHPDFAIFGQKDYQQAQVVKRLVRDLNYDIEIVTAPIVREVNGLAMSSRNTYLTETERGMATAISRGLKALKPTSTLGELKAQLKKAQLKIDYVEAVDALTLKPVSKLRKGVCVLVAVYCGKTRLIDNVLL